MGDDSFQAWDSFQKSRANEWVLAEIAEGALGSGRCETWLREEGGLGMTFGLRGMGPRIREDTGGGRARGEDTGGGRELFMGGC